MVQPQVVQNVTPRLIDSIAATVTALMGETTHRVILPHERHQAEYVRATEPSIEVKIEDFQTDMEDPQGMVSAVGVVDISLTVRQKLIDHVSAGYEQLTFYRVWDIADYLAGRFHRGRVPIEGVMGVMELISIAVTPEAQTQLDTQEAVIMLRQRVLVNGQRSLQTTEEFIREFAPTPAEDAPIIEAVELEPRWR